MIMFAFEAIEWFVWQVRHMVVSIRQMNECIFAIERFIYVSNASIFITRNAFVGSVDRFKCIEGHILWPRALKVFISAWVNRSRGCVLLFYLIFFDKSHSSKHYKLHLTPNRSWHMIKPLNFRYGFYRKKITTF